MSGKLTPRQKKFVKEYVKTGNAAEATRNAGYEAKEPKNTGFVVRTNSHVSAAIEQYASKAAAEADLRVVDVLKELKAWMCHDQRFDDPRIGVLSLKATELIGKHLRMWSERLEVSVNSHEKALLEMKDLYNKIQLEELNKDSEETT
jgi:phage terminase small subunit